MFVRHFRHSPASAATRRDTAAVAADVLN